MSRKHLTGITKQKIMSDSDTNSNGTSTSNSSESDIDCAPNEITSAMFAMTLIPLRTDLSDHTSDEEIYEGNSSDDDAESEYHDAESEPATSTVNCTCGLCPPVSGEGDYCCNEISVAVETRGEHSCITMIEQFVDCIENVNALELAAFIVNKEQIFPQRSEVEKFHKLMRLTAYKTIFHILEFRSMGIGNRYRLPVCVENRIREVYPSPKGHYIGFRGLGQTKTLKDY